MFCDMMCDIVKNVFGFQQIITFAELQEPRRR